MVPPPPSRNLPAAQSTQPPPVDGQVLPGEHVEQEELDEHDELPADDVLPPGPEKGKKTNYKIKGKKKKNATGRC